MGAITGSPYERLLKQISKMVKDANSDAELSKDVKKFSRLVQRQYEDDNIDEDEHDLLQEELEEVDPSGRSFPKLSEDDEFYMGDVPDAPELKMGKNVNLDDLMSSEGGSFTGTFGRDEFDDFKEKMSEEFYQEADQAIAEGEHQMQRKSSINRVFVDDEEEAEAVKRMFAEEAGLETPKQAEDEIQDDSYRVDDDGTEWWQDDDGYWWFREPGQEDWQAYDE